MAGDFLTSCVFEPLKKFSFHGVEFSLVLISVVTLRVFLLRASEQKFTLNLYLFIILYSSVISKVDIRIKDGHT